MFTHVMQDARSCPFDQLMWYQDLGGRKPRIFNMADHLCGGFHAKLAGVDVDGSQLGGGETRKQ